MNRIFVLVDRDGDTTDDVAFELATAARQAGEVSITGVLLGSDVTELLPELTRWFDDVVVFEHSSLNVPDGDLAAAVLTPLLLDEAPFCVLAAHSNHAMDYVPTLSVRLGRPLLTDCLSIAFTDDAVSAVRPLYGGKVHERVRTAITDRGVLVTMRPGAVRAERCPEVGGTVRHATIPDGVASRRRLIETVTGDAGEVDISQADRLVAVGRGIEDEDSLEMIRELAGALQAEIACSRPVVDKQWLPKSRQVGTSGKTVKPKLYLAIGISGSFQHIGGVKGDPFVVAVNKDPKAPIFSVADIGIVADLYDIVPLLTERLRSR